MGGRGERLRVAVVGVGHLGRIHARIYGEHSGAELVAVVDRDEARAREVADGLGCRALRSARELPSDLDAVSVVVPTCAHAEVAAPLLERGLACLVEKPLAASLAEADRLLAAAERGGATLAVGHVERFQPGVRRVQALGIVPRFIECHRMATFSFRALDVGVVHDLMIHDLDLVLELMRDEVVGVDAAGGRILTDAEDIASVRLVFARGGRANVTASRASLKPLRRFRLFSPESYVSLDFHDNYGLLVQKGPRWEAGREALRDLRPEVLAAMREELSEDMLAVSELELDSERPLQAELDAFLRCVRAGDRPVVSGEDGRRALALAERISESIRSAGW